MRIALFTASYFFTIFFSPIFADAQINSITDFKNSKKANQGQLGKPFIVLKSVYGMGFFGDFLTLIGALTLYEEGKYAGVSVEFNSNTTYSDDAYGPNWWEYYFEPLEVGRRKGAVITPIVQGIDVDLPRYAEFHVKRKKANPSSVI